MALQMDYTDETGTNHPVSYWEIMVLEINRVQGTPTGVQVHAIIKGWHDVASFNSEKTVIGIQEYRVNQNINFNNTTGQAFNNMYAFAVSYVNPDTGVQFFQNATIV